MGIFATAAKTEIPYHSSLKGWINKHFQEKTEDSSLNRFILVVVMCWVNVYALDAVVILVRVFVATTTTGFASVR